MKGKTGLFLIIFSLFILIGGLTVKYQMEKSSYSSYLELQKSSLVQGWKDKWKEHLISAVINLAVTEGHYLLWDRAGKKLKTEFYPKNRVKVDWSKTREDKQKLEALLKFDNSWERAIALKTLKQKFNEIPQITLTGYEKTIISESAKGAYQKMFSFFNGKRDFSLAGKNFKYDTVFYRVLDNGDIESFYPSVSSLIKLLENFSTQESTGKAKLGDDPFDISFEDQMVSVVQNPAWQMGFLLMVCLFLLLGLIVYLRDFSQKKKVLARRVGFLNQVIHEMKTPLAGIKLNAQLIEKYGADVELNKAIIKNVDRSQNVFEDILSIHKSKGKADIKTISPGEINSIINEMKEIYSDKVTIEGLVGCDVVSERKRLRLVLKNIVSNAIRYGEHASLSILSSDDQLKIQIKDKGPGVAVSEKDNIFKEFYRGDVGERKSPDGMGLGLAMAKRMATEGKISISLINPGETGACFELVLRRG